MDGGVSFLGAVKPTILHIASLLEDTSAHSLIVVVQVHQISIEVAVVDGCFARHARAALYSK